MKLTLFGPTGGTGRELLAQALAAGHQMTAFTRHPEGLKPRERLRVVGGITTDAAAVGRAVLGADAVLCTLGGSPLRRQENVCSTAMRQIVAAMRQHGVKRILAMSTFGAGDSRPRLDWFHRVLMAGLVLASEVADKEAMEQQLAASGLEWTAVRVGVLTGEVAQNHWRAADDNTIYGMGSIARADVAAFMLGELAQREWVGRRPAVMY